MANSEITNINDLVIGEMLESTRDNDVKIILGKYRHDVKHSANHKVSSLFKTPYWRNVETSSKCRLEHKMMIENSSTPTKTR